MCTPSGWLSLCTYSAPLEDPKPCYVPSVDRVFAMLFPTLALTYGSYPIIECPSTTSHSELLYLLMLRSIGKSCHAWKSVRKYLLAPPSRILRPESLCQERVGNLLKRLKMGRIIDNRAILQEIWKENPMALYPEISNWFYAKFSFQGTLQDLWHCTLKL